MDKSNFLLQGRSEDSATADENEEIGGSILQAAVVRHG
jgi:hypothetical protein